MAQKVVAGDEAPVKAPLFQRSCMRSFQRRNCQTSSRGCRTDVAGRSLTRSDFRMRWYLSSLPNPSKRRSWGRWTDGASFELRRAATRTPTTMNSSYVLRYTWWSSSRDGQRRRSLTWNASQVFKTSCYFHQIQRRWRLSVRLRCLLGYLQVQ